MKRVEINYCKFSGSDFSCFDNRLLNIYLLKKSLTSTILFNKKNEITVLSEFLYKKNLLISRARSRPIHKCTVDMLEQAQAKISKEEDESYQSIIEMTMSSMVPCGEDSIEDFLERIELVNLAGFPVLLSHYFRFFSLIDYINTVTKNVKKIVLSAKTLGDIFEESFYDGLEGGIISAFGKLLANQTKLYVYPYKKANKETLTTKNLKIKKNLYHFYQYLLDNQYIIPIETKEVVEAVDNNDLKKRMKENNEWESFIPPKIVEQIKKEEMLGYSPSK